MDRCLATACFTGLPRFPDAERPFDLPNTPVGPNPHLNRIRSASGRIGLCVAGSSRSSGQSPGQVPQRASRRVSVQRRGLVVCRQQDQSGEVTTSDCLDQPGGSQSRLSRCQSSGNRLKPEAALRDPCGHHCREPGLDMQQGIPCPEPGDAARARRRAADPALMSIRAAAVRRCSRTVNYRR